MNESNRFATGGNPGGGCRASRRLLSQWQGGYGAEIVIENRGSAVTGWSGTWTDTGDVVRVDAAACS